ncbi:MAG TPA: transglycosylase SLT domain-containing protein [Bryobacteraceae bacterium]|nr:transglycosylase SLT domain-containing protein [Bryobacteraceae bacterium]
MLLILLSAGLLFSTPARKHPAKPPPPPKPKVVGAAGLIAVAQHELDLNNPAAAAEYAKAASSRAPMLDDYAQYIRAQAEYQLKNYAEVAKSATRVFNQTPLSPFTGEAAALAVRAELDNDSPKAALDLIRKYYDRIPQPEGDLLLARGFQSSGDLPQAAEYYERVFYNYPSAKEAGDAATALADIKQRLGEAFPVPMPSALLGRAQKLFDAGNPAAARIELAAAIPQLGGAQRDLARVRLGEADFEAGHTAPAFQYFTALKVADPEADAERLDYLIRCVRKLDRHGDVKPFLDQLAKEHPNSLWRMDALISVADQARTDHQPLVYLPLYRSCAATFAADRRAAWCSWQMAFDSYLRDSADAADLLRTHIQKYPNSEDVDDALYFLGRLAESKKDLTSARACYEELNQRFPNTYYAVIARERLKTPAIEASDPSPPTVAFLQGVSWPPRLQFPSFEPDETAQARIERSELLALTGLNDFAENELKFGARNDQTDQPNVYAFELAKQASARGAPDQGMRYIKAYAPDYLYMPLDEAPVPFWRLAFPIPYRQSIESQSRAQNLDPYLVTALIRQESEFNVKVISYAKAYGLMQILPSTGRELARHLRLRGYTSQQLLTADRNIQLGTYYFRNLMNAFNGEPEPALASYNAGQSRANLWRSWGPFREPSEFIEIIPFHQTRSYIQIVLRNADVYRRLYSGTVPDVPVYKPKPPAAVHKRKRPVRSSTR